MPDRDWDKELAEIDRRLGAVPEEPTPPRASSAPAPAAAAAATPRQQAARPAAAREAAGPTIVTRDRRRWTVVAGLLLRLLLAAALVAAAVVWPYESRCGAPLALYLGTIALGALLALWSAVAAWRHRSGVVHVASLLLLGTALVYGARDVLPRVGYAMPDPEHPMMWSCR